MRRLLLVHYHFLPVHNVAVARLLGYARLLPNHGWRVSVLTRDWHGVDEADPSWGLSWEPHLEANSRCTFHRVAAPPVHRPPHASPEPVAVGVAPIRKLVAKLTRIGRMAIGDYPDEFAGWVGPAVAEGMRLARVQPIDLIISYCPPETNHLVGRHLATRLRVPFVPFFGDLYGFLAPPLPAHSVEGWLKRAWHRWCLAPAAATLAVTPAMVDHLARSYRKPSHLIHTGFDAEAFDDADGPGSAPRDRFVMSHVGSLYPGDQRPEIFFDGLDRLLLEHPDIGGRLVVRFIGSKCDDQLRSLLKGRPGASVCTIQPKVDSGTALEFVRSSDALLAFTCTASRDRFGTLSYPTKIFEAFGARRPVLAVPADGDWVDALLADTGGGTSARDARQVSDTLLDWFRAWERDGRVPYSGRPERLRAFTRIRQVEHLASICDDVARR